MTDLKLHDPRGDTQCWNCTHYRNDTDGGPCDGCEHPGWANFKDIRAELARVTAERDTLASTVHMLRADADKMRAKLDALRAQEPVAVIGDTFSLLLASGDSMAAIAKRNGLKVGSKLYAAPVAAAPAAKIESIAAEIETAIPTMPGQLLANLIREGVTELQSHIVYAAESLRGSLAAAAPVPLTDEQIDEEWFYIYELPISNIEKARMLARAVERAHGIDQPKEGGVS